MTINRHPMSYRRLPGATLTLVAINALVLVVVILTAFITRLGGHELNLATSILDLPAGTAAFTRPWTPITYMFTQTDVMHCLFNMLWLYWMGSILATVSSQRHVAWAYIVGGLGGALAYIVTTIALNIQAGEAMLEGSSAAVLGVVAALALRAPSTRINLFLLGQVKILWIAVGICVLFALGLSGNQPGSHIAHLGGLAAGAVYELVTKYRDNRLRVTFPGEVSSPRALSDAEARALLDSLLDKVRRSGYSSLSATERRMLIELSHRV